MLSVVGLWLLWAAVPIAASQTGDEEKSCADCHGTRESVLKALEGLGKTLSEERLARLVVKPDGEGSVHQDAVDCATCHPDAEEFPHPDKMSMAETCTQCHDEALEDINESAHGDPEGDGNTKAACWDCHGGHDIRRASDPRSTLHPQHVIQTCLRCHDKREYLDGVHGLGILRSGLDVAATCVSCHGGHDIQSSKNTDSRTSRRNISKTCGECHIYVAAVYVKSVHGAALGEKDNPDVPTCVDCHEAHGTRDPYRPRFRNSSPNLCGKCHRDEAMMAKYGLSTEVFSTYVADFHGTTAELFRAVTPDQPLNQAVCYDCHGYHDCESVREVGETRVRERMLNRCRGCHPDATTNFFSAWLGHYVPSPDRYALIYYVNLFYLLVIPGTIGFFLLYIAIDVVGQVRKRRHKVES
jgi:predicted CXXCH cytochrome family protein